MPKRLVSSDRRSAPLPGPAARSGRPPEFHRRRTSRRRSGSRNLPPAGEGRVPRRGGRPTRAPRAAQREKFREEHAAPFDGAGGRASCLFTETCVAIPSALAHDRGARRRGRALGAYWHRIAAGRFQCMTSAIVPFRRPARWSSAVVDDPRRLRDHLHRPRFIGFLMLLSADGGRRLSSASGVRADDEDV